MLDNEYKFVSDGKRVIGVIELRISEVQSVVMEQNAQLSHQLKTKIEAGKLKEERSSVQLSLDKAIDENSGLHAERQNEKSKN